MASLFQQQPATLAIRGQFDDAVEDDEDELVSLRLAKDFDKRATLPVNLQQQSTDRQRYLHHAVDETSDDDDDDWYDDQDDAMDPNSMSHVRLTSNTNSAGTSMSTKQLNLSHAVANRVNQLQHLELSKSSKTQGRDDRATSEQVMDPRTRMILFKLLSRGFLKRIDGCLSTGKEANVYYATSGATATATGSMADASETTTTAISEYAIKIYKTSILVFKDRDRYVSGENRWKRGYCKSNPRKMVKVWAEKEMRNYKRIYGANIPTPCPILLKSHVLVMEFLGRDGWPSPRLKDAILSEKRLREAYVQCILILRRLYQRCRLVHGDLSEYNLLWHDEQIYVIDVSQSVETDHPSAIDFLRKDISNVNDYFRKIGNLNVMTTRQLFEFTTMPLDDDSEATELACLDKMMHFVDDHAEQLAQATDQDRRRTEQQESVDEAVFMSSFLPRSLNQVSEVEIQKLAKGEVEDTYAHAVASLTGNKDVVDAVAEKLGRENGMTKTMQSILQTSDDVDNDGSRDGRVKHVQINVDQSNESNSNPAEDSDGDSDDDSESDDDGVSDGSTDFVRKPMTPEEHEATRAARRAERRENKKNVKESQKDKRKEKIKKKDKKRAIKKSKAGSKK
ncbi:hypothetical protein MPSEU_000787900 [Mayamaea pseudoterrestris]|nr:hypothetical protein MPSEU_000787900 [Mayamaea pseudoterrestris]